MHGTIMMVLGLAMLAAGHVLASWLQSVLRRRSFALDDASFPTAASSDPTAVLLASLLYWALMLAVVVVVLATVGVHVTSLIATLGMVSVFLGFAMQGVLNDLTSGIIIAVMRVFYIGEVIEVSLGGEKTRGMVVEFNIINTTLIDFATQTRVTVPNRALQASMVINHSRQPHRAIVIDVLASNTNTDFERIADIMIASVKNATPEVLDGLHVLDEPTVGVYDMGEVGTKMRLVLTIPAIDFQQRKLNKLRLRVRQALALEGVVLVDPF